MAHPGRPRNHDVIADEISQAIRYADLPALKALVNAETINIADGEGRTPLFEAVASNDANIITWLMDCGASVNQQDRNGCTPLHLAVQNKLVDVAALLLDRGADSNLLDAYGNGPLWRATFDARGEYGMVRLLVDSGADPMQKNTVGRSPIDFAATIGDEPLGAILRRGLPGAGAGSQ